MSSESRHLSVFIDRQPADRVYRYVTDPANLPRWAAGLSGSIRQVGDDWIADSPMGSVKVRFVADNEFGVADHDVTLPSGETVRNPMRVIADGDGCEVVFTVRRHAGMTDRDFADDCAAVSDDLFALKRLLERRPGRASLGRFGVEGIPQAVAEEVERQHGDEQGHAGAPQAHRVDLVPVLGAGDHAAP
jgi:hypothetical protein